MTDEPNEHSMVDLSPPSTAFARPVSGASRRVVVAADATTRTTAAELSTAIATEIMHTASANHLLRSTSVDVVPPPIAPSA